MTVCVFRGMFTDKFQQREEPYSEINHAFGSKINLGRRHFLLEMVTHQVVPVYFTVEITRMWPYFVPLARHFRIRYTVPQRLETSEQHGDE